MQDSFAPSATIPRQRIDLTEKASSNGDFGMIQPAVSIRQKEKQECQSTWIGLSDPGARRMAARRNGLSEKETR